MRQLGRGEQRGPRGDRELRHARLGDRRHLGQQVASLRQRGGEHAQLAVLDVGKPGGRRREHQLHAAGDQVGNAGWLALVGHVHHVDAG